MVYALVEIRKHLKPAGKPKDSDFATLMFFCDWVVHARLSGPGAREALARLDAEIGPSGLVVPKEVQPESELNRFMSLEPLREEMERFCRECRLPERWAVDFTMWREFTRLYGNVVLDCPLEIKSPTGYIKQVKLTNAVDLQKHPDKRCFAWDWSFEFSDGRRQTLTYQYSYPSPSYNPSVPSTAEFGFE